MKEKFTYGKLFFAFSIAIVTFFAAESVSAQIETAAAKRLTPAIKVNGSIGGEAHDSYVIRAVTGKTMTVELSWIPEEENRAEFTVSQSSDFFSGEAVKFGKSTYDGKRWTGRIPKTGDYYFYVVAHPSADYTIKVSFK